MFTARSRLILVTPGRNWLVSRRIGSVSCTRAPLVATLVSNLRFTSYTLTAANVYDGGWAIENRHTKRERWISRRLLREVSQSLTKPDYSCLLHGWERASHIIVTRARKPGARCKRIHFRRSPASPDSKTWPIEDFSNLIEHPSRFSSTPI